MQLLQNGLSDVSKLIDQDRKNWLCRNPEFSTNGKEPVFGGDSACPPSRPFTERLCRITLLWSYRSEECHTGGDGAIIRMQKKSVKKNILRIPIKIN